MASSSRRIQNTAGSANSFLNAVNKPKLADVAIAQAAASSGKNKAIVSSILNAVKQCINDSDEYNKALDSKSIDVTLGRIASLLDEVKASFIGSELASMKQELLDAISGLTASGVLKTFLLSQITQLFDDDAKKEDIEELKQWISENFQANTIGQEQRPSEETELSLDQTLNNEIKDEKEGDYQDSTVAKNFMAQQNIVTGQIDKLNKNLKDVPGQSGILSKISSSISSSFSRITNRISKVSKGVLSIFGKLGSMTKAIGKFTLGGIVAAISGIGKGVSSVIKGIGSLGKGLFNNISGIGKKIGGVVASPFKRIGGFFSSLNPFKRSEQKKEERRQKAKDKLMEVVAGVVGKMWNAIQPFLGVIMPFLGVIAVAVIAPIALLVLKVLFIVGIITAIIAGAVLLVLWIKKKFNWISGIWDYLVNLWKETIWPWLSNLWNTVVAVWDRISTLWKETIWPWLSNLWNTAVAVWDRISTLWKETIWPWLSNLWNTAVAVWDRICEWVDKIKFKIQYWIITIQLWWLRIQYWIKVIKEWIAKISDWISTIVDTVISIWNWLTDPNTWITLGKKLLQLICDAFKFILVDLPIFLFNKFPVKLTLMLAKIIAKGIKWVIDQTMKGIQLIIVGIENLGKLIWEKLVQFGDWLYSKFIYPWIVAPLVSLKNYVISLLQKLSGVSINIPVGIKVERRKVWKFDIPVPAGLEYKEIKPFGKLASSFDGTQPSMPSSPNQQQIQEAVSSQVQSAVGPIKQIEQLDANELSELDKSGEQIVNIFQQKDKEQQQFNQDQTAMLNAIHNDLNMFKSEALKKLDDPAAIPVPVPVNTQHNSATMRSN